MAPLPVIPFVLTIMAAVNQTSKPFHQELSMLSSLSAVGPTFICSRGPSKSAIHMSLSLYIMSYQVKCCIAIFTVGLFLSSL